MHQRLLVGILNLCLSMSQQKFPRHSGQPSIKKLGIERETFLGKRYLSSEADFSLLYAAIGKPVLRIFLFIAISLPGVEAGICSSKTQLPALKEKCTRRPHVSSVFATWTCKKSSNHPRFSISFINGKCESLYVLI